MMGCGGQLGCSCSSHPVARPLNLTGFGGSALDAIGGTNPDSDGSSSSNSGSGFWATFTKAANATANVAVPVAQTVAAVKSLQKPKTSGGAVVQAPTAIAPQTSLLDSFGPQNHQIVLYSALGLGALVLFKMVKN